MKIEDKDAMWFFYKRSFLTTPVAPPGNLCRYCWRAAAGALVWFFCDLFVLIPLFVLGGLMWATSNAYAVFAPVKTSPLCQSLAVAFGLAFAFALLAAVGTAFYRVYRMFDKNSRLQSVSMVVLGGLTMPVLVGAFNLYANGTFWTAFLTVLVIEVAVPAAAAVVVGFVYLFFTDNTSVGRAVRAYLKAVKDRNCPLVEPPQSFKDAERAKGMNVTDS